MYGELKKAWERAVLFRPALSDGGMFPKGDHGAENMS